MDIIDFDNVKIEKAKAILRYNRLRNIAKLFRLIEFCIALIFLSWFSTRLPSAVRISGDYFQILLSFVVSPLFIFILCNVIVIALLVNSGKMSGQFSTISNVEPDLFEDFLKRSETNVNFTLESSPAPVPEPELEPKPESEPEPETVVYQDKNILSGMEKTETISKEDSSSEVVDAAFNKKVLLRSQSENLKIVCSEKQSRKLRRSETERLVRSGDKISSELVDELSNEEFQRTIEAFIAKQVKFHQEEKFAVVAPSEGFTDCHI